jgi:hypothetical protein
MSENTISEVTGLQSAPDDLSPLEPVTNPVKCGDCYATYNMDGDVFKHQ